MKRGEHSSAMTRSAEVGAGSTAVHSDVSPVIVIQVIEIHGESYHQRAQNKLARVVCPRGAQTPAARLLRSVHWLSVKDRRVTYKVASLTFTVMSSMPAYLSDLMEPVVPVRSLRSSGALRMAVPRTRTSFARRSLSIIVCQCSINLERNLI